ncbi:MAG: hypothetical protein QN229_06370 [Desulfurococcaceae archaeon TW002]
MARDDVRGNPSTTSEYLEYAKDDKRKWIEKMIKSAKKYHKICPYYDKKTANCFIKQLKSIKVSKCDRDGKFDGCVVFTGYLEERYEWYVSSGVLLPVDFRDITSIF